VITQADQDCTESGGIQRSTRYVAAVVTLVTSTAGATNHAHITFRTSNKQQHLAGQCSNYMMAPTQRIRHDIPEIAYIRKSSPQNPQRGQARQLHNMQQSRAEISHIRLPQQQTPSNTSHKIIIPSMTLRTQPPS
jgi:hypothetical protein